MTALHQAPLVALPSFDIVKMEDRKRSLAPDADDLVSSRKRVVKDEHGQQMRMDAEKEKDVEVRCLPFPARALCGVDMTY